MSGRKFSPQFKLQVCRVIESGEKSFTQICREHSLSDSVARRWFDQYRQRGADAFVTGDRGADELAAAQRRVAELEAALGRATLEVDFLRRCVKRANIPLPESVR